MFKTSIESRAIFPNDPRVIYTTYVSGLKWAGLKQFIYSYANAYGLELIITDHDKGWLRETIYFKLVGKQSLVRACVTEFTNTLEEYNKT